MSAEVGDLFGALVRRKIAPESLLYGSANIHLSLPNLDAETDIFRLPDAPDYLPPAAASREPKRNFLQFKDIFSLGSGDEQSDFVLERARGTAEESTEEKASDQNKSLINDAESERVHTISTSVTVRVQRELGYKLCRPYFSMTAKVQFNSSVYRLKPSSAVLWTELQVGKIVLLAYKGISSEIFQFQSVPPPVLIAGFTVGCLHSYLREAYHTFLSRLLINSAMEYFSRTEDLAVSSFSAAYKDLLFALDTTLMHVETSLTNQLSLLVLFKQLNQHRVFIDQLFVLIADKALIQSVHKRCFVADTIYLADEYWREVTPLSWDLFEKVFQHLNNIREITYNPYALPPMLSVAAEVSHEHVLDLSYLRTVLLSYVFRLMSASLCKEMHSTLFTLIPSITNHEKIDDLILSTVEEIHASYGANVVFYLKSLLTWANARVQLLKTTADNDDIINFCKDGESLLCVPLSLGELDDMLVVVDRAVDKYHTLHDTVLGVLAEWRANQDTTSAVDSRLRNLQFEMNFKNNLAVRAGNKSIGQSEIALLADVSKTTKAEEKPSSDKFVVSSGSILPRVIDSNLIEEARNEILRKHYAVMREANIRNNLVQWRQERLFSLEQAQKRLFQLMKTEATAWSNKLAADAAKDALASKPKAKAAPKPVAAPALDSEYPISPALPEPPKDASAKESIAAFLQHQAELHESFVLDAPSKDAAARAAYLPGLNSSFSLAFNVQPAVQRFTRGGPQATSAVSGVQQTAAAYTGSSVDGARRAPDYGPATPGLASRIVLGDDSSIIPEEEMAKTKPRVSADPSPAASHTHPTSGLNSSFSLALDTSSPARPSTRSSDQVVFGSEAPNAILPANPALLPPGLASSFSLAHDQPSTPRNATRQSSQSKDTVAFGSERLGPVTPGLTSQFSLAHASSPTAKALSQGRAPTDQVVIGEQDASISSAARFGPATPGLSSSFSLAHDASSPSAKPYNRGSDLLKDQITFGTSEPSPLRLGPASPGLSSSFNLASESSPTSNPYTRGGDLLKDQIVFGSSDGPALQLGPASPGLASSFRLAYADSSSPSAHTRGGEHMYSDNVVIGSDGPALTPGRMAPQTAGLFSSIDLSHSEPLTPGRSTRGRGGARLAYPESDAPKRIPRQIRTEAFEQPKFVAPSAAVPFVSAPYLQGEMAEAASLIMSGDVYDFEGDNALYRGFSSLSKVLHVFALKSGIAEDLPLSNFEGNDSEKARLLNLLFNEKFSSIVSRSICAAVSFQCRALDQAVLLTAIRERSLLKHINAIEDTFLISQRSRVLCSIVASVIDAHRDRFPKSLLVTAAEVSSRVSSVHKLAWTSRSFDDAFKSLGQSVSAENSTDKTAVSAFLIDHRKIIAEEGVERTTFSIYSTFEMKFLSVVYDAPWPMPFIFTSESMNRLSLCTRRLVSVYQSVYIGQLTWEDVKVRRLEETRANQRLAQISSKQLYEGVHRVNRIVDGVNKYLIDRCIAVQSEFREKVIDFSAEGFGRVITIFDRYTRRLVESCFCSEDSPVSIAVESVLCACLKFFQSIKAFLEVDATTLATNSLKADLNHVLEAKDSLSKALHCVSSQFEINAHAFLSFLGEV